MAISEEQFGAAMILDRMIRPKPQSDSQSLEASIQSQRSSILKHGSFSQPVPKVGSKKFRISEPRDLSLFPDLLHKQTAFAKTNVLKMILQKQSTAKFLSLLLQRSYILTSKLMSGRRPLFERLFEFQGRYQPSLAWQSRPIKSLLLSPDYFAVRYWQVITVLFSLLQIWLVPFMISFTMEGLRLYQMLNIFYIGLDIFISINKAYLAEGEVITDRKQILKQYFKTALCSDLYNVIMWIHYYFSDGVVSTIEEFFALLQLALLVMLTMQKIQTLGEQLHLGGTFQELFDLLMLIVFVYYFAHISSCIFHYVATFSQQSWVHKYELEDSTHGTRYWFSFYWATMTMTTVGYGDVTASNQAEIICSCLIMLCSSFVFAYSMNQIGTIVKNISERKIDQKKQVFQINTFMKQNQIEDDIQSRVRSFLKYSYEKQTHADETQVGNASKQVEKILQQLPKSLNLEVVQSIQGRWIQKFKLLQERFSKQTLRQASRFVTAKSFIPGELILAPVQGAADEKIMHVLKGEVEVYDPRSGKVLFQLTEGQCYGEVEFFTGLEETKIKLISKTFSQLIFLQRSDFLGAMQNSHKEHQAFCSIKDVILYSRDLGIIGLQCALCHRLDHLVHKCWMINYTPDLERLVKKEYFLKNGRTKYIRSIRNQYPVLSKLHILQATLESFQQQLGQLGPVQTLEQLEPDLKSASRVMETEAQDNLEKLYPSQNGAEISLTSLAQSKKTTRLIKASREMDEHERMTSAQGSLTLELFKNPGHCQNVDKCHLFRHYLPHNNFDVVLHLANKLRGHHQPMRSIQKYTFRQEVVRRYANVMDYLQKANIFHNNDSKY